MVIILYKIIYPLFTFFKCNPLSVRRNWRVPVCEPRNTRQRCTSIITADQWCGKNINKHLLAVKNRRKFKRTKNIWKKNRRVDELRERTRRTTTDERERVRDCDCSTSVRVCVPRRRSFCCCTRSAARCGLAYRVARVCVYRVTILLYTCIHYNIMSNTRTRRRRRRWRVGVCVCVQCVGWTGEWRWRSSGFDAGREERGGLRHHHHTRTSAATCTRRPAAAAALKCIYYGTRIIIIFLYCRSVTATPSVACS